MCNCQNMRYLILCGLIAFAVTHPISDENTNKNLKPTSTSITVNANLLNTNLRKMEHYTRGQGLNSFLILDPVVQPPFTMEMEGITDNKRASRSLTPAQLNEPVDVDFDMELAEVNVFRPLFRYRAQVARNAGQRQFG